MGSLEAVSPLTVEVSTVSAFLWRGVCSVEAHLGLGHVGSEVVEDDVAHDSEADQLQLPHLLEPLGEGVDVVLVVLSVLLLDYL